MKGDIYILKCFISDSKNEWSYDEKMGRVSNNLKLIIFAAQKYIVWFIIKLFTARIVRERIYRKTVRVLMVRNVGSVKNVRDIFD